MTGSHAVPGVQRGEPARGESMPGLRWSVDSTMHVLRTALPVAAKFCMECAQPVAALIVPPSSPHVPATSVPNHLAERRLASRPDFEGERKQVTVLFAD